MKLFALLLFTAILLASCKDETKILTEKKLSLYAQYVDSVRILPTKVTSQNWSEIDTKYQNLKSDVEEEFVKINNTDKKKYQDKIIAYSKIYNEYSLEIKKEKEKQDLEYAKTLMGKSLFGDNFSNDNKSFKWVNKNNIAVVYSDFYQNVKLNKKTYSRQDWDEIKLLYEALDTRKNKVEKERISTSDNLEIAKIKVSFSTLFTYERIKAKHKENREAKK